MMKLIVALSAGFAAMTASPSMAACELSGIVSPASVNVTYDPFAPAQTVLDFGVQVKNKGDEVCQARLYLRPSNGRQTLDDANMQLNFRLEGQDGPGSGQAGEIGPFVVQVLPQSDAEIPVRAVLPPQQIVPRGAYLGEISLRLEDASNNQAFLAGGVVQLRAQALARTEMSISGSAASAAPGTGGAAINFGEAKAGQTERVFVNVWSNGPVTVSLSSENGGTLRVDQRPGLPSLPYATRFDGSSVDLSGPVTLVRSPPMTLAGASYEMALTLGQVSGLFAGAYKDTITVSVVQN